LDGRIGQHQLQGGVINTREVARARRLVLFRSKGEGVDVDPLIRVSGVVLVGLHEGEIRPFTLRETILTVKLELSRDDGVLTPAVEIEGGLREDEGSGIRNTRGTKGTGLGERIVDARLNCATGVPVDTPCGDINGSGVKEETRGVNEITRNFGLTTEGHDGVGERVDPVGVVEGLGTERLVQHGTGGEGRAVVNIGIGLHNKHQLFAGVVEVQLDLVGGRPDRFITRKLKLFNEVFMGVLGHTAALVRVQEDVVNVEGGGDEGLVVGSGHTLAVTIGTNKGADGPQALINGANVQVNLDFVVLKGDQGEGQTGVAAIPELKRHIERGFREGITGLAHLGRGVGRTGSIDRRERGIRDEGQLGGVTNHLEVPALLFLGQGELIPQVHPVTILTVNALTSNFDFNLGDHLLTREIEPTSPDTGGTSVLHILVDFGQSHLQVGAVSQITVSADRASHTATKVGLTVEGLFDRLHREVRVATVGHLPEGNLRVTRQVDILCAVSYELH
jgi:hypothetical protein